MVRVPVSVTAQRHFLGALKSVAKLASEWDNRKLILRLAREYRKCAGEAQAAGPHYWASSAYTGPLSVKGRSCG